MEPLETLLPTRNGLRDKRGTQLWHLRRSADVPGPWCPREKEGRLGRKMGDGQGNAEEGQASDPLGGLLSAPLGGAAPKAKGKGKGKSKSTAKPTGSLFDEGATEVKKPQATSSPGASLFDEPAMQAAASPAKTGSSLFDDDAPAPLVSQASPAGMGSLFDDEPLPKPKAKAPAAKTAPATKGKGKSAPSLFDEGPLQAQRGNVVDLDDLD
eukprot:s620_g12.t1